jgi:hypothetical protein
VAYSIVWYGLGSSLNNVELASGPVFGDVEIGCQYPPVGNVSICQGGQPYCSPGTLSEAMAPGGGWSVAPQYISNYLSDVQTWTGNLSPACNNGSQSTGNSPLSGNNLIWKQQSIVTGTGGVFNWPSNLQGLGGWACYSYQSGTCYSQGLACPNNSAPEGQQFYLAVNSGGGPPTGYVLTGVQSCNGAEDMGAGSVDPDNGSLTGDQAIEKHMESNCHVQH